ncbi:MAG TPA: MarC family protein [Chlamydiales bacterium]|nr:MarC family protein [Chlamydiales bacterium]
MDQQQSMSFITTAISLFFVFNSIGQVPVFLALLAPYDHARQKKIIVRELIIALVILLMFIFFGNEILLVLGINQSIIGIAGGLLLVLIALTLIFPKHDDTEGLPKHEPLIVPLAIPGLAGPGTIASVMLFANQAGTLVTAAAFFLAWIPSFILILSASYIKKFLGEKGMQAVERIGGMIICLIGVNMLTKGIVELVKLNF